MTLQVVESTVRPLKLLEVSGSPRERGYQHGERLKDGVHRILKEEFYDYFAKENVSKETLLKFAAKNIPFVQEYSPESFQIMEGIAEGSGASIEEVTLIQMHEEMHTSKEKCVIYRDHCTSFGATGPATVAGETFIGQNWDFHTEIYWNGEAPFLLHETRTNGPNLLAYNAPGFVTWAGMNSDGLCLSWNSVPRRNLDVGVPTYVIISEVLRSKNIGDALAAVVKAKRGGCFNFIIADENGEVYDIEATPDDIDAYYCNTTMGHANHYLRLKYKDGQMADTVAYSPDKKEANMASMVHQNRMDKLLAQSSPNIDLEACERILRDHVNYPYSICSHESETKHSITFDSWVMVPRKHEWWIARYPACQNEYVKYVAN